jgi:hypothetical protein
MVSSKSPGSIVRSPIVAGPPRRLIGPTPMRPGLPSRQSTDSVCTDLPLQASWCSSWPVTHGEVWLPSVSTTLASRLTINSFCAPRYPRTSVATAARPGCIPSRTYGSSCTGAPITTSTRSPPSGWTSSGTCAGCRTSAGTSPQRFRAGCQWWSASTGSASSTRSCRTHPPTTSDGPPCRRSHPRWGLGHLQFEALIATARLSANPNDFALVALLGLRIFEACGARIADLGEEHGHRVLRVRGKGGKVVLVPLPPAVARAIDRAVDERHDGPILRNMIGARMDRHAATGSSIWPPAPESACPGCTLTCSGTRS